MLIFKGTDVERIVQAGLISTGLALFTCNDDVKIAIYRGNGNVIALKVIIKKKKDHEENSYQQSLSAKGKGEPAVSKA